MKKSNKRNLFLSLLAVGILLTVILSVAVKDNGIVLDSEEKRRNYIESLEISLSDEPPVVKNIVIPAEFSEVYERYNELQKEAGFDLWEYRGEYAVQYSYTATGFTDDTVKVNLILYKESLIGGDIASTRLDGFMTGLLPKTD